MTREHSCYPHHPGHLGITEANRETSAARSTLEQKLWQEVQRAYAKNRDYRAGNNPEYARALAAWERVALAADQPTLVADQPGNVVRFRPSKGRK
jgi:hypothetical protein